MKSIFHHIRNVKEKPHHVRKRVAFVSAAAGAGIIAFVWLTTSLATGVFALKPDSSFADNASTGATASAPTTGGSEDLAGAGAASAASDANAPAHIEIVDVNPATTSANQAQQTTIPF
jgi:hypothetical protein